LYVLFFVELSHFLSFPSLFFYRFSSCFFCFDFSCVLVVFAFCCSARQSLCVAQPAPASLPHFFASFCVSFSVPILQCVQISDSILVRLSQRMPLDIQRRSDPTAHRPDPKAEEIGAHFGLDILILLVSGPFLRAACACNAEALAARTTTGSGGDDPPLCVLRFARCIAKGDIEAESCTM
jgi:hypothetical protein